jgi:hypothetical protein
LQNQNGIDGKTEKEDFRALNQGLMDDILPK